MQRIPVVKTKRLGKKKKIEKVEEEEEEEIIVEKILTRGDILKKYAIDTKKFNSLSNVDLLNLIYCIETFGRDKTLKEFEKKEKGIVFPYSDILESNKIEYEYNLNYNSKSSIPLGDCRIPGCQAKNSVSYYGVIYSRGDEAGHMKAKCKVCQREQ